jgi:hypothetical protein
LNEYTKELPFRPNLDSYAYGWKVETFGFDGMLCQSHSGSNEGYFSQMMRVPEDDLVVIAVGNQDKTDELDDVIDEFFRLARGLRYKMP